MVKSGVKDGLERARKNSPSKKRKARKEHYAQVEPPTTEASDFLNLTTLSKPSALTTERLWKNRKQVDVTPIHQSTQGAV